MTRCRLLCGGLALIALGLVAPGCAKEKKIEVKTVKIGAADASPEANPPAPPVVGAAPPGSNPDPTSAPKKKKRKTDVPELELSDEGELPPGHSRFSVLPASAPAGIPFAAGEPHEADRYAFAARDRRIDSTTFALSPGEGPGGLEGVGTIRDDSRTPYELPEGFQAIDSAGASVSGLPWRIRCDEDGAVMALVPEGVFLQGSNSGEANVAPEHGVFLDAYYIDLREVTAARYDKYREAVAEKRRVPRPARAAKDPQDPVLGVTWAEAHAFALWAGKDLPTEAQWEKGARGTDGFKFPWGNGPFIGERARAPGQIDKVASFRGDQSPCGAFDMAGNAREWCTDWYADHYYAQLAETGGSTARNPTGPRNSAGTNMRVVKGGDPHWLVWARAGIVQSEHPADVGFRCVLKLKPSGSAGSEKKKKNAK